MMRIRRQMTSVYVKPERGKNHRWTQMGQEWGGDGEGNGPQISQISADGDGNEGGLPAGFAGEDPIAPCPGRHPRFSPPTTNHEQLPSLSLLLRLAGAFDDDPAGGRITGVPKL
jgi:hypothetical protein